MVVIVLCGGKVAIKIKNILLDREKAKVGYPRIEMMVTDEIIVIY